jgi:hypothetical protein
MLEGLSESRCEHAVRQPCPPVPERPNAVVACRRGYVGE